MRRAIARPAFAADHSAPIAALNITPLIDVLLVLLVLLVMFILLLPTLTHEVPIDLPQPGPVASLPVTTHRLALSREGLLALDGVALDEAALSTRLRTLAADRQAVLTMRTDPETLRTVRPGASGGETGGGDAAGVRWEPERGVLTARRSIATGFGDGNACFGADRSPSVAKARLSSLGRAFVMRPSPSAPARVSSARR